MSNKEKCPECGGIKFKPVGPVDWRLNEDDYCATAGCFDCLRRQIAQANERYKKVSANRNKWRAKVGEQDKRIKVLETALKPFADAYDRPYSPHDDGMKNTDDYDFMIAAEAMAGKEEGE